MNGSRRGRRVRRRKNWRRRDISVRVFQSGRGD
jgi:hypothetical protein